MKNILVLVFALCSSLGNVARAATPTPSPVTTVGGPSMSADHFSAVCEATDKATITVDAGYVAGKFGNCFPNNTGTASGDEYNLDSKCVGSGAFIIEPDEGHGIVVGDKSLVYSLTCKGVGDGDLVTISVSFSLGTEPAVKPTAKNSLVSHAPIQPFGMALVTQTILMTSTSLADLQSSAIKNVYLGETILLAIYPQVKPTSGNVYIIPQSCEASSGSHKLTLWQLHNNSKLCDKEKAVMTSDFKNETTSDGVQIVDASMEAFEFQGDPTASVTFACNVRVCTSLLKNSRCETEFSEMVTCTLPTTTAPVVGRRRRDLQEDDSPAGRGSLHHVTATLHIRNDVMAMGGCTRVLYTVSCLVLSVLAAVIM